MSRFGSYSQSDCIFLLKDLSSISIEKSTEEREESIQKGIHYSEMLPIEYEPSEEYMDLFYRALNTSKRKVAIAVGVVAEQILKKRGHTIVLVSLARAGTPVGICIKRYLNNVLHVDVPHYTISIIRGRGIDENALRTIQNRYPTKDIVFVDGWTGKGAITKELSTSIDRFNRKEGTNYSSELAVLADPGYCSTLYGTREDFLIPSACLNSTVSGLVSRTVLNDSWIGKDDYHGAKYYRDLEKKDVSNMFVDTICAEFPKIQYEINQALENNSREEEADFRGWTSVDKIREEMSINSLNFIKPGVGETTRVLLRRVPWKILVKSLEDPNLTHIYLLAKEKGVPVELYPTMIYSSCGIIKNVENEGI